MTIAELDHLLFRVQDSKHLGDLQLTMREAEILLTALRMMKAIKAMESL